MAGMLYLVPTPIGNLGDISVRCRKTLAEADFIAAEDTRVTLKLLNYLELKKSARELLRAQQGRERPAHRGAHPRGRDVRARLRRWLPAISDQAKTSSVSARRPGLRSAPFRGRAPSSRPSPSPDCQRGASASRASSPSIKRAGAEHLAGLKDERRTMIFYEAPHKLVNTLEDLAGAFGAERRISLCRELTKLHEEVVRTTLGEAAARYRETPPKGNLSSSSKVRQKLRRKPSHRRMPVARVQALMAGASQKKDAVKQAAKETGLRATRSMILFANTLTPV